MNFDRGKWFYYDCGPRSRLYVAFCDDVVYVWHCEFGLMVARNVPRTTTEHPTMVQPGLCCSSVATFIEHTEF